MANPLSVNSELCTGCMLCQLACSFVKGREFNPAKAHIKLLRKDRQDLYTVAFAQDCDNCGFCARYCLNGALTEAADNVR